MRESFDPGLVAQLVFWAGLLPGLAVGGAVGAWKGLHAGGATAGFIVGAIGLAGSVFAVVRGSLVEGGTWTAAMIPLILLIRLVA